MAGKSVCVFINEAESPLYLKKLWYKEPRGRFVP